MASQDYSACPTPTVSRDLLPLFAGDDSTPDVNQFCASFEFWLNCAKDTPNNAAKQIGYLGSQCLRGPARDWWVARNLEKSFADATAGNYADFITELKAAFPVVIDDLLAISQLDAVKWTGSVQSITKSFRAIIAKMAVKSDPDLQHKFLSKIPSDMAQAAKTFRQLRGAPNVKIDHLFAFALQYEVDHPTLEVPIASAINAMSFREQIREELQQLFAMENRPSKSYQRVQLSANDRERCNRERRCYKCKKIGHTNRDCRSQPTSIFPS